MKYKCESFSKKNNVEVVLPSKTSGCLKKLQKVVFAHMTLYKKKKICVYWSRATKHDFFIL